MLLFSQEQSTAFCRGQLEGYFGEKNPKDFIPMLLLYLGWAALYSVAWAIPFGEEEVKNRKNKEKESSPNISEEIPSAHKTFYLNSSSSRHRAGPTRKGLLLKQSFMFSQWFKERPVPGKKQQFSL